jgi:hypothetical protein
MEGGGEGAHCRSGGGSMASSSVYNAVRPWREAEGPQRLRIWWRGFRGRATPLADLASSSADDAARPQAKRKGRRPSSSRAGSPGPAGDRAPRRRLPCSSASSYGRKRKGSSSSLWARLASRAPRRRLLLLPPRKGLIPPAGSGGCLRGERRCKVSSPLSSGGSLPRRLPCLLETFSNTHSSQREAKMRLPSRCLAQSHLVPSYISTIRSFSSQKFHQLPVTSISGY